MPEKIDVGRGIAESVCHDLGRQTIDKGCSQRLVAALPVVQGMEKELLIGHASLIDYDA
jgi:hypothetical protein